MQRKVCGGAADSEGANAGKRSAQEEDILISQIDGHAEVELKVAESREGADEG